MLLMADRPVSADDYRWALSESASLRDHRLNSRDKTVWWSVVHEMLVKHHERPGEAVCADCGEVWPCGVVKGAIADIRNGPFGY